MKFVVEVPVTAWASVEVEAQSEIEASRAASSFVADLSDEDMKEILGDDWQLDDMRSNYVQELTDGE